MMPTGQAHTRRFMPSQAEAIPIETPISSSQCSSYLPMGMVASMTCWKKFCDGSVAARRVFMSGVRPLGFVVLLGRTPGNVHHGRTGRSTDLRHNRRTCFLPSGLSPSVQDFHLVNRPLAAAGSRTVTAGSEFHRPRSTCLKYAARRGSASEPPRCGLAHRPGRRTETLNKGARRRRSAPAAVAHHGQRRGRGASWRPVPGRR